MVHSVFQYINYTWWWRRRLPYTSQCWWLLKGFNPVPMVTTRMVLRKTLLAPNVILPAPFQSNLTSACHRPTWDLHLQKVPCGASGSGPLHQPGLWKGAMKNGEITPGLPTVAMCKGICAWESPCQGQAWPGREAALVVGSPPRWGILVPELSSSWTRQPSRSSVFFI